MSNTTAITGPIIVGAGPSGLATAASLERLSIPSLIIEKSDNIAHLWHHNTYERLSLHLPKQYCELPHLHFPPHFPNYPSKSDFFAYLLTYVDHFGLRPQFHCVATAGRFDEKDSMWHVAAARRLPEGGEEVVEFVSRWLVVATGENAEPVVPEMKGRDGFKGGILHSSEYRNGMGCEGKRVLVVGCGNSGMEMCLDLFEYGALPFLSVRSGVHVLPRDLLGFSSFGLAMKLLKFFPVRLVDKILLFLSWISIGDTEKYGLKRPEIGPIELKNSTGKTPVLDVGAFNLIKKGRIKVVSEVEGLTKNGAKFADGREMQFDTVIFATGYKSNVPLWLKNSDFFSRDGKPKSPFPNGWKGENGLYCVGFTGRGLLGVSIDADKVALDIADSWNKMTSNNVKNQ